MAGRGGSINPTGFREVEELGYLTPEDVAGLLGSEPAVNLRECLKAYGEAFGTTWRR